MKNKPTREWKRTKKLSDHHLTPRSRNGGDEISNLLKMDTRRRQAWHLLFHNLTLIEIVDLLLRLYYLKKKQGQKLEI